MKANNQNKPVSIKHQAAIDYARSGFNVMPCRPNMKKPLTAQCHNDATTDLTRINYWFECVPKANVAIRTSNLLVLDVDVKNGVDGYKALRRLERKYEKLPTTRTQSTPSGGKHYIYKVNGLMVPSVVNIPRKGLDVRGHDGYIVAAPSKIDGKPYVMDSHEIAEAPVWLVNLIFKLAQKQKQQSIDYHPGCGSPEDSYR